MKRYQKAFSQNWKRAVWCLAVFFLLFLQSDPVKAEALDEAAAPKKVTVRLYDASGRKICRKLTAKRGEKVCLPGMENEQGKTMLGWSEKKGSEKKPQYQVGQRITVNTSMKLYPVIFTRSKEPNLSRNYISRQYSSAVGAKGNFSRIIFVGDSRTVGLQRTLRREFGSALTDNVYFICKISSKLGWLRQTAVPQLMRLAGENTAVVFNHGVNDLKKLDDYIPYMKKLGKRLKEKGCTLFYMSINPLNNSEILGNGGRRREESWVIRFNRRIQEELCSKELYGYLDSYSYLIQNGYGTENRYHIEDGLHYTAKTYKRIYEFCLRKIAQYE